MTHDVLLSRSRSIGRPVWIFGAWADLAIALSWVPVFVVWHVLTSGSTSSSNSHAQQGVVLALLISFLHQPLTFGLVYGDRDQVGLHRGLFTWAPPVAAVVAVVAAVFNLWIVVPVAAAWNLQHTVQQRYGLQRIYAGKAGYGSARLDRAWAYAPIVAVLLAVASMPTLTVLVKQSGLDPRNAQGVELLTTLQPIAKSLLVIALCTCAIVIFLAIRQEWIAAEKSNPAKWLYQAAGIALLTSILVDPIAGFIAYVTAHAAEYFVVVERTARRRYSTSQPGQSRAHASSFLARVARTGPGRLAYFGGIILVAFAVEKSIHGTALNAVVYAVGGLHFTYDAVIWKLRKPALAKEFELAAAGQSGGVAPPARKRGPIAISLVDHGGKNHRRRRRQHALEPESPR